MKKLDWYIIKKFLGTFLFTTILFIFVTVVINLSEEIDDFIEYNVPLKAIIFDYYFNFLPGIVLMLSPLFIFIAIIFFTSQMASRSELVAITSSGISYYRILFVPYFISAFLLMGAQLYANHYLVPKANQGLLEYEQKHSNKRLDRKQDNVNMQLNADTYLTFKSYNPKDSLGKNMALEIFDGNELSKKVIAERAKWVGKEKKWELQKYYIREFVGEEEKLTHGDKKLMALELAPNDFDKNMYLKDAMPTSELNKLIEKEKLRGSNNLPFLLIEKHKRTAMPFATLILTLIGYSIASRKTRGGLGLHILTGIAISSVFVIMAQFSTTFATNGNFSPLVAVWMPNIIFAFIGLIVVYLAPK